MTDLILDEIKQIDSSVIRNRITDILKVCSGGEEFMSLTKDTALSKFRKTPRGEKSHHDLGKKTWTWIDAVQRRVVQRQRDQKKAEREARESEMWYTREEIMLIASFMDTFKVSRIELHKIRNVLATLERDNKEEK